MTIEQLYQYTEVCRYRSITIAANNLHVSRQSISTTIKKLETEFNTELFIRLPNGVALTKAGETLYKHAQAIVTETSSLKQDMVPYSTKKEPLKICKVGISKPIMTYYGSLLYDTLSATFPNTYFHFSIFVIDNDVYPFEEFDISIILMSDITMNQFVVIPPGYTSTWLRSYPIYIWVSALSPWNGYSTLDLKMLKDVPVCLLKGSFGKTNLFCYLYHNINEAINDISIIELEQNFCSLIEDWGYYTVDIPLCQDQLSYEKLFQGRNIVSKPTDYQTSTRVIYHEETCADFYPVIASILSQNIDS